MTNTTGDREAMLYMKPELFALLDTNEIGDLRKVLQSAIEIEHSTMPPYL